MSWLQLELSVSSSQLSDAEDRLLAGGALALSLVSDADEVVLEPQPGETPLWQVIRLRALFPLDTDMSQLRSALAGLPGWDVTFLGETDWQAYARSFAVDRVFADRLHLRPPNVPARPAADGATVRSLILEPGLAFGSGSHPTTCLCLDWIARHVQADMQILDFGCGSGILAIGAALLGGRVVAIDHDEQAVTATRENAELNGCSGQIQIGDLQAWQDVWKDTQFDVVVANILATPLIELASDLQQALIPGGYLVLSGILQEQADEVIAAYPQVNFTAVVEEQWVCLHGQGR